MDGRGPKLSTGTATLRARSAAQQDEPSHLPWTAGRHAATSPRRTIAYDRASDGDTHDLGGSAQQACALSVGNGSAAWQNAARTRQLLLWSRGGRRTLR